MELVLISLLAAFCGGLAWALDHELFDLICAADTGAFGKSLARSVGARLPSGRQEDTILYRFLAIAVLLDVKDIPQVGPLQWGRIKGRQPF
jgi:hypothetical protein